MTSEVLARNTNGEEAVAERDTYTSQGDATTVQQDVFAAFEKHHSAEQFKASIAALTKAVKFAQFEQE